MATAGDLVFYGTMDGWFKAVDARTGELKWQFKTGSGIIGQPIAYRGPDNHEYVAILSGVGGWAGAIVSGDLDPRDKTAALGFVAAVPDLKQKTAAGRDAVCFRSAAAVDAVCLCVGSAARVPVATFAQIRGRDRRRTAIRRDLDAVSRGRCAAGAGPERQNLSRQPASHR